MSTSYGQKSFFNFRAKKAHGRGVMRWIQGEKYEGLWTDGYRQGKGVYTSKVTKHFRCISIPLTLTLSLAFDFSKLGHSRPLFLLFFSFVLLLIENILPMLWFEPGIPGDRRDCTTNHCPSLAIDLLCCFMHHDVEQPSTWQYHSSDDNSGNTNQGSLVSLLAAQLGIHDFMENK